MGSQAGSWFPPERAVWPVCLSNSPGGGTLAAQCCCVASAVLRGVGSGPGSAHGGGGDFSEESIGFEDASISKSMESPGLNA